MFSPDEPRRILQPLPGIRTPEIGSFLMQMDDQTRRLTEDTRGATVEELQWQIRPGMSTIGMLLAHIPIVEVFWMSVWSREEPAFSQILGLSREDDGIPMPPDGLPPAVLAGKDLAYFDDLHARARARTKALVAECHADRLEQQVERELFWDKRVWTFNGRWILYHILEHQAGHYGQINLLRHAYRAAHAMA